MLCHCDQGRAEYIFVELTRTKHYSKAQIFLDTLTTHQKTSVHIKNIFLWNLSISLNKTFYWLFCIKTGNSAESTSNGTFFIWRQSANCQLQADLFFNQNFKCMGHYCYSHWLFISRCQKIRFSVHLHAKQRRSVLEIYTREISRQQLA